MEETTPRVPLGGLARKLVQLELIKEKQAVTITEQSIKLKKAFASSLIESRLIDPSILANICSREFSIPLLDLSAIEIKSFPREIITQEMLVQMHAVPIFRRGNVLHVALSDPTNISALDNIKYQLNLNTEALLVEENKLSDVIEKLIATREAEALGTLEDSELEDVEITNEEDDEKGEKISSATEEAPIVRFINKIILDAVNIGASDLHFEPYERVYRVRFRLDGVLYEHASPPVNIASRFAARIKIMARLDISEKRVPQDGRFRMRLSANKAVDFRVSTCPTLFGEKVVLRVLDPGNVKIGIDSLGYETFQRDLFLNAINKPHGLVLVTGPTGSGKTVSLYTALNILNTNRRNISTCEDPVEINLQGINQVNVNLKAGLSFATALRSFLRQDPDIIMVGEVRDLETAEIALKAAQTGHLVLSTLHTNSASDSIIRLINMGIPSYTIASSLMLIIAQRLARALCSHCKVKLPLSEEPLLKLGFQKEEIPGLRIFGPNGCEKCKEGYKGRIGIFEVLPITPAISQAIVNGGNPFEILQIATAEGMWDLRRSGLEKIRSGLTSIDEIFRITKD